MSKKVKKNKVDPGNRPYEIPTLGLFNHLFRHLNRNQQKRCGNNRLF